MKDSFQIRRILIWCVAVVAVLAIAAFIWNSSAPTIVIPPLPNPNGYDDFVAAGNQLAYLSWQDLNPGQLKSTVASNQPALALIRKGLSKKSQVPIGFSDEYMEQSLKDLVGFKKSAFAFGYEGKLAESEGRLDDAADDYATTIALGIESSRGGYIINGLVGAAVATIGARYMTPVVSRLSVASSLRALEVIKKAESNSDSFDQFQARERMKQNEAPLPWKFGSLLLKLLGKDTTAQTEARSKTKCQTAQRSLVILEGQLASHVFERQNGRPATNWSDLVPAYLPAIPDDPTATNQPLIFLAL